MQPEILERFGAQPACDPAHLLGAMASGLAKLVELVSELVRDLAGQSFDLEHDAGERLADLVVQLARDPLALALLDEQRPARAVAPLGLQPVEHLVEGLRQRDDRRPAVDAHALAGGERIVPAHGLDELVERPERRPQQRQIEREQAHEAGREHDQLERRWGHRHRHGREDQARNASTSTAALVPNTRQNSGSEFSRVRMDQASHADGDERGGCPDRAGLQSRPHGCETCATRLRVMDDPPHPARALARFLRPTRSSWGSQPCAGSSRRS